MRVSRVACRVIVREDELDEASRCPPRELARAGVVAKQDKEDGVV